MEPRRICLTVRYDGTCFAGSQIQPGKRTVAGTLTSELESVLEQPVHLVFASRTDAGVHAEGNVCSFEALLMFPVERLPTILNSKLPVDLRIRGSRVVSEEFHPRFSALRRIYLYRVYRSMDVPVDRMRYCTAYDGSWDGKAVLKAIEVMEGEHSFFNFCNDAKDPAECMCRMESVECEELGEEVVWRFTADRFLRRMIRHLAAAILGVAAGEITHNEIKMALVGDSTFQLKPAPALGLTLHAVEYDEGK